jgi:hypothetical protein
MTLNDTDAPTPRKRRLKTATDLQRFWPTLSTALMPTSRRL